MNVLKSLWIFVLLGLIAGCAMQTPPPPFTATDLSGKLGQGYRQKVDNALIILDASSSMYDRENGQQKVTQAKNVVLHMVDTLPPLKMQTGLHVFGPTPAGSIDDSKLIYGMAAYDATALAAAVKGVQAGGLTPLAKPLLKSVDDLKESKGQIAVIVISDGIDTSKKSPLEAAEILKKTFGDRICIYTILIGNSPEGKKVLEDVAAAGKCGFATTEGAVSTPQGMADFVEKVFFEKVPEAAPVAKKPEPAPMLEKTITMNLKVLFDFDKDNVLPREQDELDEFAAFMKAHPRTTAVLEGHTDNYGSAAYNDRLSLRRAESVKKYLVKKFNIDPARLTTKGYGFSRPLATNKTEEGRQENRRVVAVISTNVKE
jgi:OOP family OmpA-OmpF porin